MVDNSQLHKVSITWGECVLMWSLETSMTQPQEFLQPPSGLSLGQVPEAARGPSQGDWEMQLVSWQSQSGGQGPPKTWEAG